MKTPEPSLLNLSWKKIHRIPDFKLHYSSDHKQLQDEPLRPPTFPIKGDPLQPQGDLRLQSDPLLPQSNPSPLEGDPLRLQHRLQGGPIELQSDYLRLLVNPLRFRVSQYDPR